MSDRRLLFVGVRSVPAIEQGLDEVYRTLAKSDIPARSVRAGIHVANPFSGDQPRIPSSPEVTQMLKNYFTIALRTLDRHKGYAFINVFGLAIGLACCLTILLFVRSELSFDRFHANADRIYRVLRADSAATRIRLTATVLGNLAPNLKEAFPGIEEAVRVHGQPAVLNRGDDYFDESGFYWSDPAFFEVFDFELIQGSPATVLSQPGSIVLTEELAVKYFGDRDPIGETLTLDSRYPLTVTGIAKAPPPNTHLQFTAIASMTTLGTLENAWAAENQGWTYLKLAPGVSGAVLTEQIQSNLTDLVWWWNLDAMYVAYELQPLTDIHLHSRGLDGVRSAGDERYVVLFSAIAILILVIACINYMNLATARATRRAREVGMRKTLGAQRAQIVFQFLGEAVLLSVLALVLAVVLVRLTLPYFNSLTDAELSVDLSRDRGLLLLFVCTTILTGLVAGSYPALFLSRFNPIRVLKGLQGRGGTPILRQSLVVVQFAITIALLVGTTVIYRQMRFIQSTNLGFDTEQVLTINRRGLDGDLQTFKDALSQVPGVVRVSAASGVPLGGGWVSESQIEGRKFMSMRLLVDQDYVSTMGLELALGRDLSPDQSTDRQRSILVNETMVRERGWENPLQERMAVGVDSAGNPVDVDVIGVVRDFHTGSLRSAIMPTILDPNPKWEPYVRQFLIRVGPDDVSATIAELERTWKQFVPNYPFSYRFLDDTVGALYQSDRRFGVLFATFTVLAIVVACLGLFGLAAHSAEQRTREIGIRKVLGASTESIVLLLSKEFVRLVAIAFALSTPIAYIVSDRWLADYAFHIELSKWIFAAVGLGALVLALLTVSVQAIRSATANPVESLRYE